MNIDLHVLLHSDEQTFDGNEQTLKINEQSLANNNPLAEMPWNTSSGRCTIIALGPKR